MKSTDVMECKVVHPVKHDNEINNCHKLRGWLVDQLTDKRNDSLVTRIIRFVAFIFFSLLTLGIGPYLVFVPNNSKPLKVKTIQVAYNPDSPIAKAAQNICAK